MILFTFSLNKLVISVIIKEIGIIKRMILIIVLREKLSNVKMPYINSNNSKTP